MVLTQENMCQMASGFECSLGDPNESDAFFESAYDATWFKIDNIPKWLVTELANKAGFSSPQDALEWMQQEISMHIHDGNLGVAETYQELITNGVEIEDSIIIGRGVVDGCRLWDGTHRIAAAYARKTSLPAILGEKK